VAVNPDPLHDSDHVAGTAGVGLRPVRSSDAVSRSILTRTIGLAPSSASLRIDALVRETADDEKTV
jgi:hypothetical protein